MIPLDIYQECIQRVPAYRAFLNEKLGKIPNVTTMEEFRDLPLMTKSDYVMQHQLPDLCLDQSVLCSHLWLRSSGTSRKPFFWPRRYQDEQNMPQVFKRLFAAYSSPEVQPTLVVVGLALGPWGTGMQSSFGFRRLASEVSGLALVSPGLHNENILEVFEKLAPYYRQTLFLSYPPFAKVVLEEAKRRGLDLPALNLHVMVGGEGITETYRERMWKLIGCSECELNRVWSLYGSTDFGNMGFENPLTIAARRLMTQNNLWQPIWGTSDIPMLFQQLPSQTFFEAVEGELVVTRLQGVPLVRYRTGDHVIFLERAELLNRLREHGCDAEQLVRDAGLPVPEWDTRFVALFGRLDQTIFLFGANFTIEQVKTVLETEALAPFYNGRFLVRTTETENGDQVLEIALEESTALLAADLEALEKIVEEGMKQYHSEFREICKISSQSRHIKLVPSKPEVFELGWKTRHI